MRRCAILIPLVLACAARQGPTYSFAPATALAALPAVTPDSVRAGCAAAQRASDAALARLVAIPDDARTFANTILAYEDALEDYDDGVRPLVFLIDTHPDEAVRTAAADCDKSNGDYTARRDGRVDLYRAVRGYVDHARDSGKLDALERRLRDETLLTMHRNGLDLPDAAREKLIALNARLNQLMTIYQAAQAEDTSQITVAEADLRGMSADYVARLERAPDGKRVVTASYPDVWPLLKECRVPETRHRAWLLIWGVGGVKNIAVLAEALGLRDQIRQLLGYASFSDYVAQRNMVHDAHTVDEFLERMSRALKSTIRAEFEVAASLAAADGGPPGKLMAWDQFFYQARWRERALALDEESVRPYFPTDRVLAGMFQVYERVLGVTISEEKGVAGYAPGVSLYDIRDADSDEMLARFYVDPYPRPGKFRHEAIQVLRFAQQAPGGRRPALLALLMNIDPDLPGKPSHLAFDEVKTLFHEFGHIMHQALGRSRYRSLAHVEGDFAEAPAELFERWVYEPEVLRLISVDPDHAGQPIPDEMVGRLVAARGFAAGLYWGGQLAYALSDQMMHDHPEMDPDAMLRDGFASVLGYTEDPDEHWAASFLHAMGGKEAIYYTYLWDAVVAADLFTRFQREGVFGERVGREYRRDVLEPAGTVPAREMVRTFLGRDFTEAAFIDEISQRQDDRPRMPR